MVDCRDSPPIMSSSTSSLHERGVVCGAPFVIPGCGPHPALGVQPLLQLPYLDLILLVPPTVLPALSFILSDLLPVLHPLLPVQRLLLPVLFDPLLVSLNLLLVFSDLLFVPYLLPPVLFDPLLVSLNLLLVFSDLLFVPYLLLPVLLDPLPQPSYQLVLVL